MAFPFHFNPAFQAIAAFVLFVVGFLLIVFSIVACTALAILVCEAVNQLRARTSNPSTRASHNLENLGFRKAHAKTVAVLAWKDGLREGLLGSAKHR